MSATPETVVSTPDLATRPAVVVLAPGRAPDPAEAAALQAASAAQHSSQRSYNFV